MTELDKELTQRQTEVLAFVRNFSVANGYAPSLREIGKHLCIPNLNAVNNHVKCLIRKGHLRRQSGKARALVVCDAVTLSAKRIEEWISVLPLGDLMLVSKIVNKAIADKSDSVRLAS